MRPIALLVLLLVAASSAALAQTINDKQATFFMGRVRYSSSEGSDCSGVGRELMQFIFRLKSCSTASAAAILLPGSQ